MKLVAIVANMSNCRNDSQLESHVQNLSLNLGALPEGTLKIGINVWLVDIDVALPFIAEFGKMAERAGMRIQVYDRLPAS